MDRKDMARSRFSLDTMRRRMIRPTGTIMAPAMPCAMRASTSCARLCDRAQATELIVNRAMAATKTRRAP